MVVASEGYRVFCGETITGRITADLPVSAVSWGQRLNDAGNVEVTIPAEAAELAHVDVRAAVAELKQFIGVSYNGVILEAGPAGKSRIDPKTGAISVPALGVWSIFDRRKALNWKQVLSGIPETKTVLSITDRTLGSIAAEIVRVSIEDCPYGRLPITLPPNVTGTHYRNYEGYQLSWIGELLRNLTGVQDGPDIRFRPRFRQGDPQFVEWVMETGTENLPILQQAGKDWVWDLAPAHTGVTDAGVERDGSGLASKVYQPGSGTERDMLLRTAFSSKLLDEGYPFVEADAAAKDVGDLVLLQAGANQLLAAGSDVWEHWSLTVRADQAPKLGTYLPGDWALINVPRGHRSIEGGQRRVRVKAVDGDHSNLVKLTVAPLPAEGDSYGESQTVVTSDYKYLYPAEDLYPADDVYPL